jgi:hypothetical protein
MKHFAVLLTLLMMASCARRVEVRKPDFVRTERYAYLKDSSGRVYIFATNTKDFDAAMKELHPGPASVNKMDLWVVTPASHPSLVSKGVH